METTDNRVTFRVSPDELRVIDASADEAGLTRTDYIRAKLFASNNGAESGTQTQIAALEKQLNQLCDQLGQQAKEADKPPEKCKCRNADHAQLFGCGHCFICDIPIYVPSH
jgi:uncharacterized protein (DUF1778 family)